MLFLDERLTLIASLARANSVADIGCDHGKLGFYLIVKGLAEKVIASDISADSLEKARLLACENGLSGRMDTRLGDGLSTVNNKEVETVVIAGLGGDVISDIISSAAADGKNFDFFVLSPNTHPEKVRETLLKINHEIIYDDYVFSSRKAYPVIKSSANTADSLDDRQLIFGKFYKTSENFVKYANGRVDKMEKIVAKNKVSETMKATLCAFKEAIAEADAYLSDGNRVFKHLRNEMKNRDIFEAIERFAPKELAEDWDNTGFSVGSANAECKKIAIGLDLTVELAELAAETECNLIITHHPFIFNPIKCIDIENGEGRIINLLIKHGISAYSAHTNLDKADGGINAVLSKLLCAKKYELINSGVKMTFDATTLEDFAKLVSEKLNDDTVSYAGEPGRVINTVFAIGGSGGSEGYVTARGIADAYLTGDVKHHDFIRALNDGFLQISYSHYASEICAVDIIAEIINNAFPEIKIVKAGNKPPFKRVRA